ncbi:MAG: glycoside hydrolase family 3 C-terminal domain-containing protein [Saprospiraceae bacterium]|nr:glycoside hydrolase family 3 C-terminal domain-containing protein [Saprospiraceae bacterium]
MNIEEKAGQMFISGAGIYEDGSLRGAPGMKINGPAESMPRIPDAIRQQRLSHFNVWMLPGMEATAKGIAAAQQFAIDSTRLGIPITFATDPRHAFSEAIFSLTTREFSLFPEELGFGAIGDPALVRRFADIARQEYVAVGLRLALHPVADLATEPRWPRNAYTFGEDAQTAKMLTEAYVQGFQGEQLSSTSVACMTKHFPGGGPQKEGLDPHFEFQKGQVYPGDNFAYHMIPFEGAFAAKTASIMPYYGVPTDQTSENVGMSYNKEIITGLLRQKFGYDGIVCTDWGLLNDDLMGPGIVWKARAWGVESLTPEQRVQKIIEAGCDQFGGEACPEHIVSLVKKGVISEARIDESVRRILKQKFQLGLFDNPFPDVANVSKNLRKPEWVAFGNEMQRRAMVMLKNDNKTLPLSTTAKPKLFIQNMDKTAVEKFSTVVEKVEDADWAILRLQTPWQPYENTNNPFAKGFHHGDLDFKGKALEEVLAICRKKPTIVVINLDRPAVIPEIAAQSRALLADFGADDAAVLDVLFGIVKPEGKLPFELPSSMEAVRLQKEDVPHDSKAPLFPYGFHHPQ